MSPVPGFSQHLVERKCLDRAFSAFQGLYITIFGLFEQRSFELPSSNAGRPRSSHGSFQNEMYERLTFFLGPTWERYQHGSIKYTIRTGSNSGESFDICRYFSFFMWQFWYRIFSRGSIYDLAFKPDGSQLIVAAGNRVLVISNSCFADF